jgi:hypothetical protein
MPTAAVWAACEAPATKELGKNVLAISMGSNVRIGPTIEAANETRNTEGTKDLLIDTLGPYFSVSPAFSDECSNSFRLRSVS